MTSSRTYNPTRQKSPKPSEDPLEVSLVFNVRPCGTCDFFWPEDPASQPYGPFPSFDFESDMPEGQPAKDRDAYAWLPVKTREPSFPNGEVMDGCRKAPIMTIGINPNLTAFSPGRTGAAWAYPSFTDAAGTDAWTKYAYYYRYRSVYQERFDLEKLEPFFEKEGRITAEKAGKVVSATRASSDPSFELVVRYEGDSADTKIPLERSLGAPRYVLLVDRSGPASEFAAGDLLAVRLNVPAGKELELWQQKIGYYEQFVPTLDQFSAFLREKKHAVTLAIGEDVCQLDMVACASPHWNPAFLGGTKKSEDTVIDNCVVRNAWAVKQLVQTRPAVLFLVGESSYSMFRRAFGAYIKREYPLSLHPSDGAFTLFRETLSEKYPCTFEFSTEIDGSTYSLQTRLIVTPHFSYDTNFMPQIRLSKKAWAALREKDPACAKFLEDDPRIQFENAKWGDVAFLIEKDADAVLEELEREFPDAYPELMHEFYDPHKQMAEVLEQLYDAGKLSVSESGHPKQPRLERTEGSCRFCVNQHWTFPLGCPYGKPDEPEPPTGFLDKVAAQLVAGGRPSDADAHAKAHAERPHAEARSRQ